MNTKDNIFSFLKEYRWIFEILGSGLVMAVFNGVLSLLSIPEKIINTVSFAFAIAISTGVITYFNFKKRIILDKQELSDEKLLSLSENSKNSFYQLQIALKYLDKHANKFRSSFDNSEFEDKDIIEAKKTFISNNKDCLRMICSDFSNFLEMFSLKRRVRFHIHLLTKDINIIKGRYVENFDKSSVYYYSFFDDEITFQERIRSNVDSEYIFQKITKEMMNNINSIMRAELPEAEIINYKDCLRIITPLYSTPSRNMVSVFGFFEIVASKEATIRINNLRDMDQILINKALEKASILSYYVERLSEYLIVEGTSSANGGEYDFLSDIASTLNVKGVKNVKYN